MIRKILQTRDFDMHLMEAGEGILRVTFTAVGNPVPKPSIGVRPELVEALNNVVATEPHVVDIGEFKHIIMGAFSCIWDGISLTVRKNGLEGDLVAKICDINLGLGLNQDSASGKPSCRFHRLGSKKVYGCGEKYSWINLIGSTTTNWNTDVMGRTDLHHGLQKEYHTSIPFFLSEVAEERGFTGCYVDNIWCTAFDFDKEQKDYFSFSADGGILDLYLFHGLTPKSVVRQYGLVTGTLPMPRLDFMGFQQCRWSYMDQQEVLQIAEDMRRHEIPCDVLYLDIDYMKDYKVFTIDRDRFPDFKGMTDKLKAMGLKTVAIIDPGVKAQRGYGVYDRGLEQGLYVTGEDGIPYVGEVWPGRAVFPDFLNEKTRLWWGREHRPLLEEGVDGFWNDMNEPADFSTTSKTVPETCLHRDDDGICHTHSEIHNVYATYEAQSTFEYLKSQGGQERPFVLTRSAFAGTQRYAAIWTGDNTSLWEHMESAIPMLLNLGLSGYAYAGGDIGGFQHDSDGEMLARWTQLGAFMPLFRNHSAKDTLYQEPWRFGDDILKITKSAIEMRYSLITYLYQQMRTSHLYGDPVMQPLFYEWRGTDSEADIWNINDQFLYGPDMLVCPILRPRLTKRAVYFPQNLNDAGWYDLISGQYHAGGHWTIVDAPLEKIPVFVREGTILPVDPVRHHLKKERALDRVTFHLYGAQTGVFAKGSANFYFDDGLGEHDQMDNHVHLTVNYEVKTEGHVEVTVASQGHYPLPEIDFLWKGEGEAKGVWVK